MRHPHPLDVRPLRLPTPTPLSVGLELFLPLDGHTLRGGRALDLSGNMGHGNIMGAQTAPGVLGEALCFDGENDIVTVADDESLRPQRLTVALWVYNPDTAANKHLLNKRHGSSTFAWRSYTLSFWASGGYCFYINDGGSAVSLSSGFVGEVGWHHVVGTYDGADMKIYVDGDLKNTNPVGPVTIDYYLDQALFLGGFDNSPENAQTLDEVMVYSRGLTAGEVRDLSGGLVRG